MNQIDQSVAADALKAVFTAFPDIPFPAGMAISRGGRWFDESGAMHVYQNPEADEIARFFGGRAWTTIEPRELLNWDHGGVSLIWITPGAHAYYLPSYLRAFLAEPLDGYLVLDHALQMWTPPSARSFRRARPDSAQQAAVNAALDADFDAFVGALTRAQRSAVAITLEALEGPLEDEDPNIENLARSALDVFWRAQRT